MKVLHRDGMEILEPETDEDVALIAEMEEEGIVDTSASLADTFYLARRDVAAGRAAARLVVGDRVGYGCPRIRERGQRGRH